MPRKPSTPLKVKKNHLANVKIRQSWNKYNLYNLARQMPYYGGKRENVFKQKWTSKSMARTYHGEHIREKQWLRMFDRRIRSVIPMDAEYLASNDGSLESAGRGSGLEERGKQKTPSAIPYMQMTFAPMERRLDTAIFRAMFASSARQARQFVVHGAVKVNGKQMRYPGYLLNPGDLFQVEPGRVMWATGAPKISLKAIESEGSGEEDNAAEKPAESVEEEKASEQAAEDVDVDRDPREVLKDLRAKAKSILSTSKGDIGAKRKQDLRAFSIAIKKLLSRSSSSTILTDSLEAQFAEIQHQLNIRKETQDAGASSLPSAQDDKKSSSVSSPKPDAAGGSTAHEPQQETILTDADYNELYAALRSMHENPVDDSKPYATPWMPRDYMSAFAFIPRFLEVNHNICAAVYLRHPVARPGLAEVPTPYHVDTHSTAFAWYLRRR